MSETKIYRGVITESEWGENWKALMLAPAERPFALSIEWDASTFGQYLSCRYFISDAPLTDEAVAERIVGIIVGDAYARDADGSYGKDINVKYSDYYSDITGHLWTDEWVVIGGHDLVDELRSHVGEWAWVEITYHKDPV